MNVSLLCARLDPLITIRTLPHLVSNAALARTLLTVRQATVRCVWRVSSTMIQILPRHVCVVDQGHTFPLIKQGRVQISIVLRVLLILTVWPARIASHVLKGHTPTWLPHLAVSV